MKSSRKSRLRICSACLTGWCSIFAGQLALAQDVVVLEDQSSLAPSGGSGEGATQFESLRSVNGVVFYVEYVIDGGQPRRNWKIKRRGLDIGIDIEPALSIDPGDSQNGPLRPLRLMKAEQNVGFVAPYQPVVGGGGSSGQRVGLWQAPSDQFRIDFSKTLTEQADIVSFDTDQAGQYVVLRSVEQGVEQVLYSLQDADTTPTLSANLQQSEQLTTSTHLQGNVYTLKVTFDQSAGGYAAELYSHPANNFASVTATLIKRIVDPSVGGLPGIADAVVPTGLWRVKQQLLFFADDLAHGCELWISDGSANGTRLLKDINTGAGSSVPVGASCHSYAPTQSAGQRAVVRNGILYFYAFDGVQEQLWRSDGTPAGTVRDNTSFVQHYSPFTLQRKVNGWTYYAVFDGVSGPLWKTNGDSLNTTSVSDRLPLSDSVTELAVASGRLYVLSRSGEDLSKLYSVRPTSRAPKAVTPIRLTLRETDRQGYGEGFGSSQHREGVEFRFVSPDGGAVLLLARGYDIDVADEVEVRINTRSVGLLKRSRNNQVGKQTRFILPADQLVAGENILQFIQKRPGEKYGITNVRVVPLRGEERSLVARKVDRARLGYRAKGGSLYPQILPLRFADLNADAELKFRAFDIDKAGEVTLYLNNEFLAQLPITRNKSEEPVSIVVPQDRQQDTNLIEFRQATPGYQWGVRNLLLRPL